MNLSYFLEHCELSVCILLGIYFIFLYYLTGKNRNTDNLFWCFMSIFIAGVGFYLKVFDLLTNMAEYEPYSSWLARIILSVQYSLEMFVANTVLFKPGVLEIFKDNIHLLHVFMFLYGAAILTSGFAVFHFLSRWLYNNIWLLFHSSNKKTHIFLGINDASINLANDIAQRNERVVFIDLPDSKDNPEGISIWDIIARFFQSKKSKDVLSKYPVLKAGRGLKRIYKWLKKENNQIYILSSDQSFNIAVLEKLWEHKDIFKCKIYCHAKKEGLINRYDNITDTEDRIKFIDSSYLAVESLKYMSEGVKVLPVHCVDIAEDPKTKQKLGYVTSPFNCAIVGFGETGKEVLKFLYEFGAFTDESKGKSPFKCHVFDINIDKEVGEFGVELHNLRSPKAKENEFELHSEQVGTVDFNNKFKSLINDLQYIAICLGNDRLNIETALNIVEMAEILGKDTSKNFCIIVRQSNLTRLNQDTLLKANETYNHCIHAFGMSDVIWKEDIITNRTVSKDARRYFDSYVKLSTKLNRTCNIPDPDWDSREEKVRDKDYATRCKARRQRTQDFSNSLHQITKRLLCEPYGNFADAIYEIPKDKPHCDPNDKEHCLPEYTDILERMAICEHLRWEASHIAMGYRFTDGPTQDLKKLHNCIRPYEDLDPVTKHFDWLVVKNSLPKTKS